MKVFLVIMMVSSMVMAKHEHREHSAHKHGAGTLAIAFDGAKGQLQLQVPGESIFGFEYEAVSEKDKKIQKDMIEKLQSKISEMVVFEAASECKFAGGKYEVKSEKKVEAHKKGGKQVKHKSEHSDVMMTYDVVCAKSPVGTELTFNFQKHFPRIHDLDVSVIADAVQKSVEAKANGTKLLLK